MSDDLQRLVDTDDDPRIRGVLAAGLHDGPSPEQVRRAAAALGLSAVTGAVAVAHASAGASAATTSKGVVLLSVFKWLGIGMIAGGITAGASVAALSSPSASSQPPGSSAAVARATRSPAAPTRPVPTQAVEPSATQAPVRTAPAAATPTASSLASPQASVASFDVPRSGATLRDEIAMLDQARRALESNDAAAALAALDRYQSTPSKHALGAEALLLRVRALDQAGRGAEARRLGQSYIARHPDDTYAQRLRRQLGIVAPSAAAPSPSASPKVPTASF